MEGVKVKRNTPVLTQPALSCLGRPEHSQLDLKGLQTYQRSLRKPSKTALSGKGVTNPTVPRNGLSAISCTQQKITRHVKETQQKLGKLAEQRANNSGRRTGPPKTTGTTSSHTLHREG